MSTSSSSVPVKPIAPSLGQTSSSALPRVHTADDSAPPSGSTPIKKVVLGLAVLILLGVGGYVGWQKLNFALAHEETDDAQVEGHLDPVLPRVAGYVTEVLIRDNQHVTAGQSLVRIDSRDYDLKVAQAEAALRNAEATLANARAAVEVAKANVGTAVVAERKAQSDLTRDDALAKGLVITDKEYDASKATADTAVAQHQALLRHVDAAESQLGLAQTQIAQRQADLDYAKLQTSYTTIAAPTSGYVSRKTVEPGQYIQAGQSLLTITGDEEVWVVANFKETQLAHMHEGQPTEFSVDSYPGIKFRGKIDSLAGATGAKFALLPPDNASGNFVKVTQRV